MLTEAEARLKAQRYDQLLKDYGSVVAERDQLLTEVSQLRETVRSRDSGEPSPRIGRQPRLRHSHGDQDGH